MGVLSVKQQMLDDPDAARLLAVEDADGKKIEYLFEITSSKEAVGKNGKPYLKLGLATDYKGNRIYVDEILTYDPNYIKRLSDLVKVLGIATEGISEESFIGRFFYATVLRNSYQSTKEVDENGNPKIIENNKVDRYIRAATPEEVTGVSPNSAKDDDMPF